MNKVLGVVVVLAIILGVVYASSVTGNGVRDFFKRKDTRTFAPSNSKILPTQPSGLLGASSRPATTLTLAQFYLLTSGNTNSGQAQTFRNELTKKR